MSHSDECLICGAPLVYLDQAEEMECSICYEIMPSKTRCQNGHFVCDWCHTQGMSSIVEICLRMADRAGQAGQADRAGLRQGVSNPVEILEQLMDQPFCHMHGPEHHSMVGAALLTAYYNAGGQIGGAGPDGKQSGMSLEEALHEMMRRGREVPGGACGFWGACGAGISTGMFMSIITGSTPLQTDAWGLSNQMTAAALAKIGEVGGPRCCKRDSYLAMEAAVRFCREKLGVTMDWTKPVCSRSRQNNQCIGRRCPFSPARAVSKHGE